VKRKRTPLLLGVSEGRVKFQRPDPLPVADQSLTPNEKNFAVGARKVVGCNYVKADTWWGQGINKKISNERKQQRLLNRGEVGKKKRREKRKGLYTPKEKDWKKKLRFRGELCEMQSDAKDP